MKRFLLCVAFLLSLLISQPPTVVRTHAAETNYTVDGYLSLSTGQVSWAAYFATTEFALYNGQSDYLRFSGLDEWEFDHTSYAFAHAGVVTLTRLIQEGVINPNVSSEVEVYYELDGGYGGTAFLGSIYVVATPSYLDTYVGIINNSYANRIVSYHNRPTRAQILSDLRAFDEGDGDVTLSITETTSVAEKTAYDGITRGLDTYYLIFQAKDSQNNIATLTIRVTVIDTIAPTILGPDSTVTTLSANEAVMTIVQRIWSTSDLYDSSPALTVQNDTYTPNKHVVSGIGHLIELKATDRFGNSSYKTVRIIVEDDVKPTITGTANYTKGSQATLSLATIQGALQVADVGTTATLSVSWDGYSSKSTQRGTYKIHFYATDSAGNRSEDFIVLVSVTDDVAPIFFVNGIDYQVSEGNTYSLTQLLFVLESNGTLLSQAYEYEVVLDNYSRKALISGRHSVVFNIKYEDGQQQQVEMNIVVPDQTESDDNTNFFHSLWLNVTQFVGRMWLFLFA